MNDRGRIPFALVGVLLLVTSATLVATVGIYDPRGTPEVDRAMDGATAQATTELRGAADDAAAETAAAPVTAPANTTAGRALNDSQPFRDALRLRLYLTARDRLETVEFRRGDTAANASLPPVEPTTEGYREAIERVHLERAGTDDAALRVEIEGVTLTATRDNRTVASADRSPSFVVANPALLLHDRTREFERRANASVANRGVGQRLTARLYPIAWARGYAQYGGAPISTVLGNRHVELATNDALLAEQQAVFGTADPGGDRGVAAAGRRVATTDMLAGIGGEEAWTDDVLDAADEVGPDPPENQPVGTWRDEPSNPEITVGVNTSADHAFADLVGIDGTDELPRIIERAHTVEARLDIDIEPRLEPASPGPPSGGDWELDGESTRRSVDLEESSGSVPAAEGWETRDGTVFVADVTTTTTRRWETENKTARTTETVETTHRVRVATQARTAPIDGVPQGDLDGALSAATERATNDAVRNAGGHRGGARRAVVGGAIPRADATAEPVVEREFVEDDVRPLWNRTRDVSVSVPGPAVGAGRANPPAQLREEISTRRDRLTDNAGTSAEERTLLAARVAYLDGVDSRLETRGTASAETNDEIDDAVSEHIDSDRLDGAIAAHRAATRPTPDRPNDPAGNLSLAVDTAPAYLPTGAVSRDRMGVRGDGSVRPLAARNVNVFTSPHGQVAESVLDRVPGLGADRVALSTAAGTLASMEEASLSERQPLQREVESATAYVRGELLAAMVDAGIAEHDAREALETDRETADEALELANGTAVDEALRSVDTDTDEAYLRVRLETTLEDALQDRQARPRLTTTNEAADAARERYRDELEDTAEEGLEAGGERARKRALGERMGSIPAGLPVAPVPGYWYATVNVWYVDTGGTYERFAVRSDRGDPTGTTTYLRDGRTARLDHAGENRRLGENERVSFRTRTAVVVAVPPGPRGVGDTDGVVDERSPGWPP